MLFLVNLTWEYSLDRRLSRTCNHGPALGGVIMDVVRHVIVHELERGHQFFGSECVQDE